ncbi:hypothetical protein BH10PSE12_BH10PSE12_03070 [soil metagenome]
MAHTEIWAVSRMGSKLSACVAPDGQSVSIGITNLLAHTGVANSVSLDQARDLAAALLAIVGEPACSR